MRSLSSAFRVQPVLKGVWCLVDRWERAGGSFYSRELFSCKLKVYHLEGRVWQRGISGRKDSCFGRRLGVRGVAFVDIVCVEWVGVRTVCLCCEFGGLDVCPESLRVRARDSM